jgi:hypothetical protein
MSRTTKTTPTKPAHRTSELSGRAIGGPVPFHLGDTLQDTLTGFSGIAVCCTEYLYGCRRWGLQPTMFKDGAPAAWVHFDEPQLVRVKAVKTLAGATSAPTGGPRPDAPPR